ncbi:uncharacterized protein LOC129612552 [Condylostylus longicornis]|uniref:uncharacterized protein LOC129605861 n=1 Tax=Condylostylus longicornis TaxID=2530218 RepID=UPI00244DCBE2|nr:uncharacterized protein LOC129605861 [Condylostylus longicornis]XP_055382189.1 uncharacterized protein LOC129612552 [Condylostylus longicornis]
MGGGNSSTLGGGSTLGGSGVPVGGGGSIMGTGISSSTVGHPGGVLHGSHLTSSGALGGSASVGSVTGTPGNGPHGTPGSVVDPRAVSVVVTLPGPQHGQALSDYGPI